MANDFVADPMNRVKPGDIVSVRVISIDEKRGRIGFSMKPEADKSARPAAKPATRNTGSDEKASRSRSNRPNNKRPADKRATKPRDHRRANDSASNRSKAQKADAPAKMGTLGALLQEAGVTKSKK